MPVTELSARKYRLVLATAASEKEAQKIALAVLQDKLAACVNIVPKISSSYWWKGKIETASEALLVIKTKSPLIKKLIQRIKSLHSYSVPEIISLPILEGNADYLKWIDDSLLGGK